MYQYVYENYVINTGYTGQDSESNSSCQNGNNNFTVGTPNLIK
jgi:hypothetical protein